MIRTEQIDAGCVKGLVPPSVHVPNQPQQTLDAVALSAGIACPVHLVHVGADQVFKPEAFALVRAALERRPAATVVQIHPGAVHSFMCPDLQGVPANAAGSRLSWPQVVAFLDACLAQRTAARNRSRAPDGLIFDAFALISRPS